jgi:citrate synthase
MSVLHEVLEAKVDRIRRDAANLVEAHGGKVISEVTVKQAFGGMRGVKALVCDTSHVDPEDGVAIRGIPIRELADRLPEEVFFLLCTGELPDERQLDRLQEELFDRVTVPQYVWNVICQMPPEAHPMAMLSSAVLVLQRESEFQRRYDEGLSKEEQWRVILDDILDLVAKIPIIAAGIYRIRFGRGLPIHPSERMDWGAYYTEALGFCDSAACRDAEFTRLARLYLVLHCDHEGGNVSAHASTLVASALSDPYLAVSAGLNGLTGPLHGVANQNALRFVLEIHRRFDGVPDEQQLRRYIWDTLEAGRVVPGYGHAVLRATDPRFKALYEFGRQTCPEDPIFRIVDLMYRVVPDILKEQGKAKDPYPNVDAVSGSLLYHFGIKEFSYYTVLFAISRCMGMLAQVLMHRILGLPIERPKSVTSQWIREQVESES